MILIFIRLDREYCW